MKVTLLLLAIACWPSGMLSTKSKSGALQSRDSSDKRNSAEEECYPCEILFSKLNGTSSSNRSQHVEMQLRGEPKSGTGFMHEMASGALYHACSFLRGAYGEDTCQMSWTGEGPDPNLSVSKRSLVFDPSLGGPEARCSCEGVGRVEISISKLEKHTLPVNPTCRWWHKNSISPPNEKGIACATYRGKPVANHNDLWGCMKEAACSITDSRPQFVVMRDPRPMAVSAYYHRLRMGTFRDNMDKEQFIADVLPHICQWLAIRHILFTGLIPETSSVFWYDDALADPYVFNTRYYESVGLHLPGYVVEHAAEAAQLGDFEFHTKGIDIHPGGEEATLLRSWKDEISPELLAKFDDVVRLWLPPALLARLGV